MEQPSNPTPYDTAAARVREFVEAVKASAPGLEWSAALAATTPDLRAAYLDARRAKNRARYSKE